MLTHPITLNDPQRFATTVRISEEEINHAISLAEQKLLQGLPRLADDFTPPETINFKYEPRSNNEWTSGMNTGVFWLAYELTGNQAFYDAAKKQVATYAERFRTKTNLMDHDVGFIFTPSCVADYKVTGNPESKQLALDAAAWLLRSFTEKGGFIKRGSEDWPGAYRTLVDTMMNLPLLLWAGKESGNPDYTQKVIRHYMTTAKYLVREDGSTFHHYQFNPETLEPERGLTLQGYSDDSCWSRGHSWLVYGYPIAYSYTRDEAILPIHQAVTYYFLNHLPQDGIPYWDFVFGDGSSEPRDSSAAAVAICGLLEMCKYLSDDNPDKVIFQNAADGMMRALIDTCINTDAEKDGILAHVTHGVPQNRGIDESAIYGDYFFLEALLRYKNPDWKMYW